MNGCYLSIKKSVIIIEIMSTKNIQTDFKIELWLGDIIEITSPSNEILHENTFIINYIDKQKLKLLNTNTLDDIIVHISEEGLIGEGDIVRIGILDRCESPSYAIQNNLLPDKWIKIHIGGLFPAVLIGQITNLENDMIEIKTIELDTIYINFEYKGLPENLPITSIEITEEPDIEREKLTLNEINAAEVESEAEADAVEVEADAVEAETDAEETTVFIEDTDKKEPKTFFSSLSSFEDNLKQQILKADQVHFSEEDYGHIVEYKDVSTKYQRYSLEDQVTDLLDSLLSTIPTFKRTPKTLNDIHIKIERFKQLRERFSNYDEYGNVEGKLIKSANYKPLSKYFHDFNINLYWILPIVKNIKKMYDVDYDEDKNDVLPLLIDEQLASLNEIMNQYRSNTLPAGQNTYSALYTDVNPFFTPFDEISEEDTSIIIDKSALTNMNTVADNLDNMVSSVFSNNNITSKRFVIQKYNNGLLKLNEEYKRANLTKDDNMSIKSFLTLPEPVIRFSKINLPGTKLLDKVNLHLSFLNYWQFLKKHTIVNNNVIDSLEKEISFNEDSFATKIKNYVFNIPREELLDKTKQEAFEKFINIIIPKTKILFDIMKKYIFGKLSIVEVISYLEPFLIYTDDLTYMQYVDITRFINEKISEYNSNFMANKNMFKSFSNSKTQYRDKTKLRVFNLIHNDKQFQLYNEGYEMSTPEVYSNSELIQRVITYNSAKLYTSAIASQNIPLMFPSELSSVFENEKDIISQKIESTKDEMCINVVISKYYTSLDSLLADNDKNIYFDKKYDKTNYGVLEDKNGYEKQVLTMDPEQLYKYIVDDLVSKKHMSLPDAEHLAETLLNGKKRVLDNHYAVLYKGYREAHSDEIDYYVRKDNKWVIDEKLNKSDINTLDDNILCNLQTTCSNIEDKCENMENTEYKLQHKLLKDVINEFDNKYKLSKEELEHLINYKYEYYISLIPKISRIKHNFLLKYNNEKYKLSLLNIDKKEIPISPYSQILQIILSQQDFVKLQYDIVRFCERFTRKSISGVGPLGEFEKDEWLYCNKTNVPLIPSFKLYLAKAYVTDGSDKYIEVLEVIKKDIGKQSDDCDWWCDKNSGWNIVRTDFDVEEGYENGFKMSTKSVLEEDIGEKINVSTKKTVIYENPESIMIHNIVNALSLAMGINIEQQKEYIINIVSQYIKDSVSEEEYKKMKKRKDEKGEKTIPFIDYYNATLLYYVLGAFLIAVQTTIPFIKTRKTHPGCVRSFTGYPFDGEGDDSSVVYLACVAYDIRESGNQWGVLKRKKMEYIVSNIKKSVSALYSDVETRRKIDEKTQYLLTTPLSEVHIEHDITNWIHFLPPLIPFKLKTPTNLSEGFKGTLLSNMRSGNISQSDFIMTIHSKIFLFSIAIIERIQKIVKKNDVILNNSNNEPYIENACCESVEKENTIEYFFKKNPEIKEYNETVNKLTNIIDDITYLSKSTTFSSKINTKNNYPPINNTFSEKTIYLAFILYCKFKTLIPIPENIMPFCVAKPAKELISANENDDNIIRKLKSEGYNYTEDQLLGLIQMISKNKTIRVAFKDSVSPITKMDDILSSISKTETEDSATMDKEFYKKIKSSIASYTEPDEEYTKETKDLNKYLNEATDSIKKDILSFIRKYSKLTSTNFKKLSTVFTNLYVWSYENPDEFNPKLQKETETNEGIYMINTFYNTFIANFAEIFPNIILNKVDYKNINIPNYYGFSLNHSQKLKKYVGNYYETLRTFYDVPILIKMLITIQEKSKHIVLLSKNTPILSSVQQNDTLLKPLFDEKTSRLLFEYYLLNIFNTYMELCKEDAMVFMDTSTTQPLSLPDIFSTEFLDDLETKSVQIPVKGGPSQMITGNKIELCNQTAQLFIMFIQIMNKQKDIIDISYQDIKDKVFKLKEKEKNMVTDKLKLMTREDREIDTMFKINKLGMYSKGLQKGLTLLDKDFYDEEQEFRDKMNSAEKAIRKQHKDVDESTMEFLIDDYMEEQRIDEDIQREENGNIDDMEDMDEYYNDETDD